MPLKGDPAERQEDEMRVMIMAGTLVAVTAAAGAAQNVSQLAITGTSTVRGWSCTTRQFEASVQPSVSLDGLFRGEKVVSSVVLTFPVSRIDCGNDKMEEHLMKALKAEQHPAVTYELSAYDIATAESGATVQTTGRVIIAGSAQPIRMTMALSSAPNGQLRVRGETPLSMTTFGVKPPTLMLGTLKVGDAVKITFDVLLSSQTAASIAAARN